MNAKIRLITDLAIIFGAGLSALTQKDAVASAIYFACTIAYVIHIERRA
jgi:hypothetical protein